MEVLNDMLGFDVVTAGRDLGDSLYYLIGIIGYVIHTFVDNAWPLMQMLVGTLTLAWTTLCGAIAWAWQMCGGADIWARQMLGVEFSRAKWRMF